MLVALITALALTGCMRTDIGVTLNKNGTGSLATSVGIEKGAYNQLKAMGTDPFDGKTTENVTYGGETYVTYTDSKEYSSYEEIKAALLELTYNSEEFKDIAGGDEEDEVAPSDYTLFTPEPEKKDDHIFASVDIDKKEGIFYSVYTFRATVNPCETEIEGFENAFKLTVTLNMPDKVTQAKGGVVDGKTVVFDFEDLNGSSEIAAVSEVNNYGVVLGIIGALVIAAVVFFIIVRKKK